MKYISNFSLFESIDVNKLDTLKFIVPVSRTYEISAMDGDVVAGFSQYIGVNPDCWKSELLWISPNYRRNDDYPKLALILRLLTHAFTKRTMVVSKDFSRLGSLFMLKYEALGYWKFDADNKKATLTKMGVEEAELYAKKYMNIDYVRWVGDVY